MLSPTPPSLKSTDINRFIMRAAQLEKLKPPIAYWCYYWAVNQILSKNLHMQDEECKQFTAELMDKLEQFKEQHATDEAIVDDLAGQAYVEQFASETFQRAENALRASKATKQTADTFQAAATFLNLIHIWMEPSPEVTSKIKYAKYHALRIAKALVAGEDPNLSNPIFEEEAPQESPIQRNEGVDAIGQSRRQPSVEEVPDEEVELQKRMARQSSLDESLHPSRAGSVPRGTTPGLSSIPLPEDLASQKTNESYFPKDSHRHMDMPLAPVPMNTESSLDDSAAPLLPITGVAPPPIVPEDQDVPSLQPTTQRAILPHEFYTQPPNDLVEPFNPPLPRPQPRIPKNTAPMPASTAIDIQQSAAMSSAISQNYHTDDMAVLDAQKHAKWAISALNFEDVPTAVKELREALKYLGAL